jgi:signal transduction histidine kinase
MNATKRRRTLSLRLWLVLVVVAVTGTGFLAQMGLVAPVSAWEQQGEDTRLASVRQIIGTDLGKWRDPAWQRHADAALAALGVDVALFSAQPQPSAQPGQALFMTAGARRYLDTSSQDASGAPASQTPASTLPDSPVGTAFQRLVIANPAPSAHQSAIGVAFLWDISPASGHALGLVWAIVEWGTFALTLAIVLWLIGQPVLRPLAEMSEAAQGMAGGDLEVHPVSASPVREIAEVSEAMEGMSAALRDSLARQAALEEDRRLFVSAVAHDLRTPLFMLRGYLKGLERGVAATPEKIAHYLGMCRTQADTLERLIGDLFAYTRLEYLDQEPERAPLELGALLREAVEDAQPLAAPKGITLVLEGTAEPCAVLGDRHLLVRAVENLLDNARRHTPAGGKITVRWHRVYRNAVFAVEDTGPGIAAQDLPHLFTPLYRGEDSRNRNTGGAGLGLAIARRILRAHGGDLRAANAPSGGAVFTGSLKTNAQGGHEGHGGETPNAGAKHNVRRAVRISHCDIFQPGKVPLTKPSCGSTSTPLICHVLTPLVCLSRTLAQNDSIRTTPSRLSPVLLPSGCSPRKVPADVEVRYSLLGGCTTLYSPGSGGSCESLI